MSTTGIITAREYVERIKSKSFIIGTSLVVLGIFALAFIPVLGRALGGAFTPKLVVVAPNAPIGKAVSDALSDDYIVTLAREGSRDGSLPKAVERDLRAKKYDAALTAYQTSGGLAFTFYPRQANLLERVGSVHDRLVPVALNADLSGAVAQSAGKALHFPFKIVAMNERYKSALEETFGIFAVVVLIVLLYVATLMYGVFVGQGVVEEKSNRVMEIMIGAVRPVQLLAGKIFGIGALALTQMLTFALASGASVVLLGVVLQSSMSPAEFVKFQHQAASAQQFTLAAIPLATLVYLVVFFFLGFFSYAALFGGVGALCSKSEDVQQFNGVFVVPIIVSYMLAIFALSDPDKPLIVWSSFIPLVSPMVMFTRVAMSSVPSWQIAVSIGLSVAAIWGFMLLAAKLYRIGVLMYGKPPTVREILRALRAPA